MTKKSIVKERILIFLAKVGEKTADFCQKTDIARSNFLGENMKSDLSSGKIIKILSQYPELSPVWLLTGEGEMLRSPMVNQETIGDGNTQVAGNNNTVHPSPVSEALDKALDEIAAQRRLVERSQQLVEKTQEQIDRLISIIESNHGAPKQS